MCAREGEKEERRRTRANFSPEATWIPVHHPRCDSFISSQMDTAEHKSFTSQVLLRFPNFWPCNLKAAGQGAL